MQNGAHDHGAQPTAAPPYPPPHVVPAPAARASRTLLIVLAVVTAGALLVCCGGSAAAVLYFRTHPGSAVAEPPARRAAPTTPPAEPAPPSAAPAPPPPIAKDHTIQGRGSKVVPLPALPGPIHMVAMKLVVRSFGSGSWDLLVDEIGRVSGKTTVPAGTRFVEITADGAWSFARA